MKKFLLSQGLALAVWILYAQFGVWWMEWALDAGRLDWAVCGTMLIGAWGWGQATNAERFVKRNVQ